MTPAALETITAAALCALALYACLGLAFAAFFVSRGAERLDAAARGMPLGARLLIVPGTAALWPWLLWRWRRQARAQGAG